MDSSIWTSIKTAIDVNPWRAAAFATAGAFLFVLRHWGALPFELPVTMLWIIGTLTILAAAIVFMDMLRALAAAIAAGASWVYKRWLGRKYRKQVLRHLDTLSGEEKEIFGYLLVHNERSFVGASDGGKAQTLIAKDLVRRPSQIGSDMDMAFVIPEYVWDELQKRKDEFPDTYKGQAHPWRRPMI